LSREAEAQLYGIGREALANVVKHARAQAVEVRVSRWDGCVRVEIEDDGCGFDPGANRKGHFGLDSMRSRAAEIGAELSVASAHGCGTVVRVDVPVGTDRVDRA
jgi:signal transduction histidine kinase